MKWIIIDKKTKEPGGEVLAIGNQDECIVGYLSKLESGDWECESDGESLGEVTAFIPIKDVVASYMQQIKK